MAAALLSACSGDDGSKAASAPMPAQVGVYVVQPSSYTVRQTLPGRTRATMISPVRPQVDGIIEKRMFREGAQVAAGDVLYHIDDARYAATVNQAKAQLEQAQATLQADAPLAQRYQALAKIDAISKQDRDNAVATLAEDRADVDNAQASLATARINLGYTQIKAPISGQIGASDVTPGALVTANQSDALATITQLDPIYIDIQQSSAAYLRLKQAIASGELTTDADNAAPVTVSPEGSDQTFSGKLQFASVTVDADTGSVMLRALVKNPDHDLLPGMYVRATLTQGIDVKALLVPQQGVMRDATGKPSALVVTPDGQVARHALTIAGATDDNRWRVTQGLEAGDRVIVQGAGKVKVGDTAQTTPLVQRADHTLAPVDARPDNADAGAS